MTHDREPIRKPAPLDHSMAASERKRAPAGEEVGEAPGTQPDDTLTQAKPAFEGLLEEVPPLDSNRLGRYRLDRLVGSGGMGVVYEAHDTVLQRRVAVKVLGPGAQHQVALERFQQEALLTARLQHPHVVVVHEAGSVDGRAFIAMEFVDGQTLEAWIDDRLGQAAALEGPAREAARLRSVAGLDPLELREVCSQIRDVADALHHGHTYQPAEGGEATPIIHRDVKPGNIMIDRHGKARLLDFGLAKELGVALTVTREALGTPLYMSPEQLFSAKRVGPRSDVYSLGMTLYACATLARPFELSQPALLFQQLMHEDPRDPGRLNPALPEDLRTILLKATAKDERDRYETAQAFAQDLDAFLAGRLIAARPPTLARHVRRFVRRHRVASVAAVLLTILAVGFGVAQEMAENRRYQETLAAAARMQQEREAAADAARLDLDEARLLYELAALSKGEDPDGDRWLTALNAGHEAERRALESLAKVDAPSDVDLERRALLARHARNDREALGQLRGLIVRAEGYLETRVVQRTLHEELRRLGRPETLELFKALCLLSPAWRGVVGVPPSSREINLARRLEEQLGLGVIVAVLVSPDSSNEAEQLAGVEALLLQLAEKIEGLSALADAIPSLEAAVEGMSRSTRVTVSGADEDLRATLLQGWPQGEQAVAEAAAGQPLESVAWGELIVAVRAGGKEARIPVDVPRPGWGSSRAPVRVEVPASVAQGPLGMRLVAVPGLSPFWMDEVEVRVEDYQRFLESLPEERREEHAAALPPRARPQDPVTGVSYQDAVAYAEWAGSRLPTFAEWRAAAFAGRQAAVSGAANLSGYEDGYVWLAPSGVVHRGPLGHRDLVGNVAEWLLHEDPDLPFRQAAGGSWSTPLPEGFRERFAPDARGADLGFRCVRSVSGTPGQAAEEAPERVFNQRDGAAMHLVPGGAAELLPVPRHYRRPPVSRGQVVLTPFYVDALPVSQARYVAYLDAAGLSVSPQLRDAARTLPHMAVAVSWEEAAAYAASMGKRLPTEAEYDVAYQGKREMIFGQPEWCLDVYADRFFEHANRHDPVNRWAVGATSHVVRLGAKRSGKSGRAAFRCVVQEAP